MKKNTKVFLLGILALVIIGFGAIRILSEPLPEGVQGDEADALSQKIQDAVHTDLFRSTEYIAWTFAGRHDYLWDRNNNLVSIGWRDVEVLFDLDKDVAVISEKGKPIPRGNRYEKIKAKAWTKWCNDSYWLQPMSKFFDPGVTRSVVKHPDGDRLLITHSQGGVTPGDSYLWIVDDQGLPSSWKMWTSIIPIKGLENSWTGWVSLESGALISCSHSFFNKEVEMISNPRSGRTLAELGASEDLFLPLQANTER